MMSWHTPTHSSQMKTVGPAINFRTSFWLLLQNEHRRTSSVFFFKGNYLSGLKPTTVTGLRRLRTLGDDFVNDTIFLGLVCLHDVVAFYVLLDPFHRLMAV